MSFENLGLTPSLLSAVRDAGYVTPTPIQTQAIPHVLARRDVLGTAQTGTGKTAAFALPIIQHLEAAAERAEARRPRVLVLAPTRELAAQIDESFDVYGRHARLRHTVVFGGVGHGNQIRAISDGVHVLVATPGRLLDLMQQRVVDLSFVKVFVLDEADRMLDMGFMPDVRRVLRALPQKKQTLLFSATMPPEIRELASGLLHDPAEVTVTPVASTVDAVEQSVFMVTKADKRSLLLHLVQDPSVTRCLVFSRTKHGANRITAQLQDGGVPAAVIHGNKSQNARERALSAFKSGDCRVLVATDIAARGIDVDGVSHVINFDIPNEPESYVHRIGRTARAGASGTAWSFCDREERGFFAAIERTIRKRIPVAEANPYAISSSTDSLHPPRGHVGPRPTAPQGQGQASGDGRAAQSNGNGNGNGNGGRDGRDGRGAQGHAPGGGPSRGPRRPSRGGGGGHWAPRGRRA